MKDMKGDLVEVGDRVFFNKDASLARPFNAYGKVVEIKNTGGDAVATIWVEGETFNRPRRRFGCNLSKVFP